MLTCSVIVPCHPRNLPTLPRTLRSLEVAAEGLDVEQVVVEDPEGKGLSWARNRGLERAKGDVVFFADADDAVRPAFFRRHLKALESAQADFVLSSTEYAPLKRSYDLSGNAAIRAVMLPAFFGYHLDDVRRWNAGGMLVARREQGGVWRCAFRRDFIERHAIRFDEKLFLYEDSPFIAECACCAEKVASIDDVLYEYEPGTSGILANSHGTDRYWDYKFAALENRKQIALRVGGETLEYFRGSAVFTVLELMQAHRDWRRYAADPFVAESLRQFPLSMRHPLVALAVTYAKCLSKT